MIGVIGAGSIADRYYMPHLSKLFGKKNLEVIDVNIDSAFKLASKYRVDKFSTNIDVNQDYDCIVIATPPSTHFDIAMSSLDRTRVLVIEKPVVDSMQQYETLIAANKVKGIDILVNFPRRLYSINTHIKKLVQDGFLGDIKKIDYSEFDAFNWGSNSNYYLSYENKRGVFADRGSHIVDLISWWLDEDVIYRNSFSDKLKTFETLGVCNLESKSGIDISIKTNWLVKMKSFARLVGTRGSIEYDIFDNSKIYCDIGGNKTIVKISGNLSFDDCAKSFCKNVAQVVNGGQALIPIQSTSSSVSVVDEFYKSSALIEV